MKEIAPNVMKINISTTKNAHDFVHSQTLYAISNKDNFMKKCEVDTAIRRALNMFDEWNDCTGVFQKHSSYYCEMQGVIEDAVHCGIQQALNDFHKIGDYEIENVRYSVQQRKQKLHTKPKKEIL